MFVGRLIALLGLLCVVLAAPACARETAPACQDIRYIKTSFTVCKFSAKSSEIRTFLNADNGKPYANFSALKTRLAAKNQTLVFAMNGGMYKEDRSAAGLYIENGVEIKSLNTNKGPGNFHMMPNGVFYVGKGGAGVLRSDVYAHMKLGVKVHSATQSGPMLVIDGKLHPKFNIGSTSIHIRNGVGVDGDTVYFAVSNERVNFHTFARLFKDYLKTPNALYLDGAVSKLYAPDLNRNDMGRAMGPIIAVVEEAE